MVHEHNHSHDDKLDHLSHQHGKEITLVGETKANIHQVWELLTVNEKLQRWFPELSFNSLVPGGQLIFTNKSSAEEETMLVVDVEVPTYLSYMWGTGNDMVAFELEEIEEELTQLTFTQWVQDVNEHTAIDIAGWHVKMQLIGSILEGTDPIDEQKTFEEVLPTIQQMLANE